MGQHWHWRPTLLPSVMSLPSARHQHVTLVLSCRRLGGREPNPPATLNSTWVVKTQVIANTEVNKYKSTWIKRFFYPSVFFESDNIRQNPPRPWLSLALGWRQDEQRPSKPQKGSVGFCPLEHVEKTRPYPWGSAWDCAAPARQQRGQRLGGSESKGGTW